MLRNTDAQADKDYSFGKVPDSAKKGLLSMTVIMVGFTLTITSMSVGTQIGNEMDYSGLLLATLWGSLILSVYCGVLAYVSASTGLSLDLLCRRAFGSVGSFLPSAVMGVTQMAWFGIAVAMLSEPIATTLGVPYYLLIAFFGLGMTATAYFGIKSLEIVSDLSVPIIIGFCCYSLYLSLSGDASAAELLNKNVGDMTLATGITLVIGSFISGGTSTPNFVRFAKSAKIAVIATVVAYFCGNGFIIYFSSVVGAQTGQSDIFFAMMQQGLLVMAIVVFGANVWTTNNNTAYTSALAVSNMIKVRAKPLIIASGFIATLFADWMLNHFVGFLLVIGTVIPPIGAVIAVDYFFRKSVYDDDAKIEAMRWPAVLGIVLGAVCANVSYVLIPCIDSMIVAGLSCIAGICWDKYRIKKR